MGVLGDLGYEYYRLSQRIKHKQEALELHTQSDSIRALMQMELDLLEQLRDNLSEQIETHRKWN